MDPRAEGIRASNSLQLDTRAAAIRFHITYTSVELKKDEQFILSSVTYSLVFFNNKINIVEQWLLLVKFQYYLSLRSSYKYLWVFLVLKLKNVVRSGKILALNKILNRHILEC